MEAAQERERERGESRREAASETYSKGRYEVDGEAEALHRGRGRESVLRKLRAFCASLQLGQPGEDVERVERETLGLPSVVVCDAPLSLPEAIARAGFLSLEDQISERKECNKRWSALCFNFFFGC